jgi:phospholipid transport system substrate-binding protein
MRPIRDFLVTRWHRVSSVNTLRRRGLGVLLAAVLIAAPSAMASATTDAAQAKKLIEDLSKQALSILKTEKGNLPQREAKFRTILSEYFAMSSISRTVAGQHWQEMSPKQQSDFQKLFSEWVLKTYARRFGGYQGENIAVGDTSAVGRDSVLVQTTVSGAERNNKVEWRVRNTGKESNKIVDVSVDGVSKLVTQRSEIASIVKNQGVNGMLDTLRAHVQKADASR